MKPDELDGLVLKEAWLEETNKESIAKLGKHQNAKFEKWC